MNVSVVIPSFKPGAYIYECLDSLCAQTMNKELFEIIVVLNGCNEPYQSEIRRYIVAHPDRFISLIQTDVPGVSNARNIALDRIHGDYVTFIDDDDVVSSTYLENLYAVSSATCVGCANSYAFIDSIDRCLPNFIGNAYQKCKDKRFTLYDYRAFLSPPVAKLIHKSVIGKYRFPVDMKKSEDSVFCLQISTRIKNMKLASSDAIYYQRLREGSAMRSKQAIFPIIREHLFIEYKYLSVWIKAPYKFDFKFFLSRLVACCRNCIYYINNQGKI